MPFHDGHLASAESITVRRGVLHPVRVLPVGRRRCDRASDTSVARPLLRAGALIPLSRERPILRGVRTSLDRVLRTPVKGCGVETIRGAFLR